MGLVRGLLSSWTCLLVRRHCRRFSLTGSPSTTLPPPSFSTERITPHGNTCMQCILRSRRLILPIKMCTYDESAPTNKQSGMGHRQLWRSWCLLVRLQFSWSLVSGFASSIPQYHPIFILLEEKAPPLVLNLGYDVGIPIPGSGHLGA